MQTVYDVQQFLKRFGTIIYIGDRLADLELMEAEFRELQTSSLLSREEFIQGLMVLRREIELEKDKLKNKTSDNERG